MAKPRNSKRDLEMARLARAAAKRERAQARAAGDQTESVETVTPPSPVESVSQEELLEELATLHARFADGGIPFDEFEADKALLLQRLDVT